MNLILMLAISACVAAGVWLLLARDLFRLVIGLAILGNATNLVVFSSGRPGSLLPPIIAAGETSLPSGAANPLPQALVLTAIVIGFALLCFALVLVAWLARQTGHTDPDALRAAEPEVTDAVKPPVLEA